MPRRLVTRGRLRTVVFLSGVGMIGLMALECVVTPPQHLPHLHPTLNAIFSCGNLCVAYLLGVAWQWQEGERARVLTGEKDDSGELKKSR